MVDNNGPMSPSRKGSGNYRGRRNTRGIIKELLEEEHEEVDKSRRSARKIALSMSPTEQRSRRQSENSDKEVTPFG